MNDKSEMVSVPRELLQDLIDSAQLEVDERLRAYGEDYRPHVLAAQRKVVADACAILAAPAEDVRAVREEQVGYAATQILEQIKFSNVFSVGVPMRTGEAPGFEPLYRHPQRPVVLPEKYDDVLLPFLALMRAELHANAHKGDRPGWLSMDRKTAVLEVFYHMGKLHQAVHRDEAAAIREYAADVANMCMMLTDVCGCLDEFARLNPEISK